MELSGSNKPIKILIIPDYDSFGGTLTFLIKLLKIHQQNGIETSVLIERKRLFPKIIAQFQELGVKIYTIPNRSYLFSKAYFSLLYDLFSCWKAYKTFLPDLIVVSTGTPPLMMGAFAYSTPVLFTLHTYPERKHRIGMRFFATWMSHYNNYVMTVSKFGAARIQECIGIPPHRIHVVYNSYSTPVSIPQVKQKIVLTIGHVAWYKNPECWLDVARQVIAQIPDVKFIWLGDGQLLTHVSQRVQALGLNNNALLLGYCSDVASYYTRSMICFQPSLMESQSIAVIEAMSYGLPCVTSNIGGLPESVIHGETGFTCSPTDVNFFSSKIITLLDNSQLREKMGLAGRQRVESLFSEAVQESKILNLYKLILGKNG